MQHGVVHSLLPICITIYARFMIWREKFNGFRFAHWFLTSTRLGVLGWFNNFTCWFHHDQGLFRRWFLDLLQLTHLLQLTLSLLISSNPIRCLILYRQRSIHISQSLTDLERCYILMLLHSHSGLVCLLNDIPTILWSDAIDPHELRFRIMQTWSIDPLVWVPGCSYWSHTPTSNALCLDQC